MTVCTTGAWLAPGSGHGYRPRGKGQHAADVTTDFTKGQLTYSAFARQILI